MNPALIALILEVVIKNAPALFMDFVQLLSKAEPTDAERQELTAKLVKLMNPSSYYPPGTPPVA
jgi:hypothetical protein